MVDTIIKQLAIIAAGVGLVAVFAASVEMYMGWPTGSEASKIWRVIMTIVIFSSVLPFQFLAIKVTTTKTAKTKEQT